MYLFQNANKAEHLSSFTVFFELDIQGTNLLNQQVTELNWFLSNFASLL